MEQTRRYSLRPLMEKRQCGPYPLAIQKTKPIRIHARTMRLRVVYHDHLILRQDERLQRISATRDD